ncbi:hypothetical protein [Paenibacillus sp. MBLB4367]|uniref:hypothetical protein n=1 Tax=Paenibacillus sp. MBLB4367 TaxID=3384767 RepID=UPI00390824F1
MLHKAQNLIGRNVGISLANGQGVSGVICGVRQNEVYVLQYLYHTQFATFHYPVSGIRDILPFPPCHHGGGHGHGQGPYY